MSLPGLLLTETLMLYLTFIVPSTKAESLFHDEMESPQRYQHRLSMLSGLKDAERQVGRQACCPFLPFL
jgi:hypothetical protein